MVDYATWNPSDKHANISLSNGSLTASSSGTGWRGVRSDISVSSGKHYFEFTIDAPRLHLGIGTEDATLSGYVGSDVYSYGIYQLSGAKRHDGSYESYGNAFHAEEIVMCALDLDNGKIWWGEDGTWYASGNPATGANPAFTGISGTFYAMCAQALTDAQVTANFGASAFSYSPPSGFRSGLYSGTIEPSEYIENLVEDTGIEEATDFEDWAEVISEESGIADGLIYEDWAEIIPEDAGMDDDMDIESYTDFFSESVGIESEIDVEKHTDDIIDDAGMSDSIELEGQTDDIGEDAGVSDDYDVISMTENLEDDIGMDDNLFGWSSSETLEDDAGVSDDFLMFGYTDVLEDDAGVDDDMTAENFAEKNENTSGTADIYEAHIESDRDDSESLGMGDTYTLDSFDGTVPGISISLNVSVCNLARIEPVPDVETGITAEIGEIFFGIIVSLPDANISISADASDMPIVGMPEAEISLSAGYGIANQYTSATATFINSLGHVDDISMISGFGHEDGHASVLSLCADHRSGVSALLEISADGSNNSISITNEIDEKDINYNTFGFLNSLEDRQVLVPDPADASGGFHFETYQGDDRPLFPNVGMEIEVYLDGSPILDMIDAFTIIYDEDQIHNQIEITAGHETLFSLADESLNKGTIRLRVDINSRSIYFLLDERTGEPRDFKIWGRSASARDEERADIDLAGGGEFASSLADEFLLYAGMDWRVIDWIMPADFEFSGRPLEGIQILAKSIDAVVRSDDDGNIIVRARHETRPVNLQAQTPVIDYDRVANIFEIGRETGTGSGYTSVEVLGYGSTIENPNVIVEDPPDPEQSGYYIGEDVFVRVYWPFEVDFGTAQTFATAGSVEYLGVAYSEHEQQIEFRDYTAQIQYPPIHILEISYIGLDSGMPEWRKYSRELIIDNLGGIATVKYIAEYQRYKLKDHQVSKLLAALEHDTGQFVSLTVAINNPAYTSRPAPAITRENITDEVAALAAGTAWLDQNLYDREVLTIQAPYSAQAIDGAIVYVNDAYLNAQGNYRIKKAIIKKDGPELWNELEMERTL